MNQYFIKRGDKVQGPATLAQIENLRSKLKASDLIATSGTGPWTTWDKVEKKLFPVVEEVGFANLEIPAFQQSAIPPSAYWQPQQTKQAPKPEPKRKSNKTLFIGLGIVIGFLGLVALSAMMLVLAPWSAQEVAPGIAQEVAPSIAQEPIAEQNEQANQQLVNEHSSITVDSTKFEALYRQMARFDGIKTEMTLEEIKLATAKAMSDEESSLTALAFQIYELEQVLVVVKYGLDFVFEFANAEDKRLEQVNNYKKVMGSMVEILKAGGDGELDSPAMKEIMWKNRTDMRGMERDIKALDEQLDKARNSLAIARKALAEVKRAEELFQFALIRKSGILNLSASKKFVPLLNSYGVSSMEVDAKLSIGSQLLIETSSYADLRKLRDRLAARFGEMIYGKQPELLQVVAEWNKQTTSPDVNRLTPELLAACGIQHEFRKSPPADWVFVPR